MVQAAVAGAVGVGHLRVDEGLKLKSMTVSLLHLAELKRNPCLFGLVRSKIEALFAKETRIRRDSVSLNKIAYIIAKLI